MPLLWVTGAASVVLAAAIAIYLAPLHPGVLALQFAFTPKAFAMVVHAWPPEDLERYRAHLPADFALLGCYGWFGHLLVTGTALFRGCHQGARMAAALALPLAAAFDAAENVLHWWLTAAPRFGVAQVYFAAGLCSTLKWLLLFGFGLAAVWAFVRDAD